MCKPIPEAIHVITLSDANKSGPFFSSKLSDLLLRYPETQKHLALPRPEEIAPFDTVLEGLETFHFDKGAAQKSQKADLDNEPYTILPDSLDLQELVFLSARIKLELRELLFMLDNIPNYLRDGGLNTLEKRKSIQRHKKSISHCERSAMNDFLGDHLQPIHNPSDEHDTTKGPVHEQRKSIQDEILLADSLNRRKSLRSHYAPDIASFERRPSTGGTERDCKNLISKSMRRASIHKEASPRLSVSERRKSLQSPYGSPEKHSSLFYDSLSKSERRLSSTENIHPQTYCADS